MMRQTAWLSMSLAAALVVQLIGQSAAAFGEPEDTTPFKPTWTLMNKQEKQQFIAGYLHGMQDAGTMLGLLATLIKESPTMVESNVQHLRSLYGSMADGQPDLYAREIDAFFKDPKNENAPPSRAVTAVRNKF